MCERDGREILCSSVSDVCEDVKVTLARCVCVSMHLPSKCSLAAAVAKGVE